MEENTQKPKKVLVVDDDQTLLDMYKESLEANKFQVITAMDGEEALEKVKTEMPDCVLLDILLPKINGFDVLHNIRNTPEIQDIPVIMLTALVQESNKDKGITEGANDFVLKSETKVGDVIQKIKNVIEKRNK